MTARTHDDVRPGDPATRGVRAALVGVYLVVVALSLLQQPGLVTYDTRAELTQRPGDFLAGAFALWHPESGLGEVQNQAYGYLFPQGPWFWLHDLLGTPEWVAQRLWTALVLVVAAEGVRRVAERLDFAPAPAAVAGLAYAFAPRLLGTVGVLTGESLPGAVAPWVVLPLLAVWRGRSPAWRGVLLSAAAVTAMGGVNAVENAGSLPPAALVVLWGVRAGWLRRRVALGWLAAVAAASLWWALPLLLLGRYAPPFYAYVESARDTTALLGWSEAWRGSTHWVSYLVVGGQPWWPAAYALATSTFLVVVAAVLAGGGVAGLLRWRHPLRAPFLACLVLGLTLLTIGHGGAAGAPVAGPVRDLLDGALQIFRNVHKIDPSVRLPLALGLAHLVTGLAARLRPRPAWAPVLVGALVLSLGQPFLLGQGRTPGWDEIATPWVQARDLVASLPVDDAGAALVVPGSGFAQQTWGWTLDEPLLILGGTRLVTRSQVPLVPGPTIRVLDDLDRRISSGRAGPALAAQLRRVGVGTVVVRRDLLRTVTSSPSPTGATASLAQAGFVSLGRFGGTREGGAEVEVYDVPGVPATVVATPLTDVATLAGAPEALSALAELDLPGGLPAAAVLAGQAGWDAAPSVVTDTDQRRERSFGGPDEALSAPMGPDDPWRTSRAVHDYPLFADGTAVPPTVARYDGLRRLTASSSQGYADNFGPVVPAEGPAAAVDGLLRTRWVTSSSTDPRTAWLRLDLDADRPVREVTVWPVAQDDAVAAITTLEVRAGEAVQRLAVGPTGAPVTAHFDGTPVDRVEVRVVEVRGDAARGRVGLREVSVDGRAAARTLVVPTPVPADGAAVLQTPPQQRACRPAPTDPDCDVARIRGEEEPAGLDRTLTLAADLRPAVSGLVVARGTPEASRLLDPLAGRQVGASSVYGGDPRVAPRFLYDDDPTTAWVSAPSDPGPTVVLRFAEPRTITGLRLSPGPGAPVRAVLRTPRREVAVDLGAGTSRVRPLRTAELEISLEPAPGWDRVVVRELALTGVRLARPFDPDAPTGAVCGLGPNLRLGAQLVRTAVSGTMGDVVRGQALRLRACDGPVDLPPGGLRVRAVPSAEFQVTALALDARPAAGGPRDARAVTVERWDDDHRTVAVAPGAAALLHLPENANPGWRAEIDGVALAPITVDGWQQGWLLPAATDDVRVDLVFAAQRSYAAALVVGLGVSGAMLLLGLVLLLRRPAPTGPRPVREQHRRRPGPVTWLGSAVTTGVLLGPVALVGLVAGASSARLRRAALAGGLVALTGVLDVVVGAQSSGPLPAGDVVGALAVGLVLAIVLAGEEER
ncbi:alpha-(1-_3)-arabinofuranosyltransferase family protein [Nocardioides sp.]|uniref:alpha-(1->3)-arabinofuranosyltransferase domain-containing protein n=1 Tax=Nocardioides sp. TaxID=35761 RepID=UPI003518D1A9